MSDVIVVGGGVIGLTIAWKLAEQGTAVTVVEQGTPGREASWAGAGMLPPANLDIATTPAQRLRALSHLHWNDWSHQLSDSTGIDNGYRACGALEMAWSEEELIQAEKNLNAEGAAFRKLMSPTLQQVEPALTAEISSALQLPEMAQVRNPRHLKALLAACRQRGVKFITGEPVIDFEQQGDRITGVRTGFRLLTADHYCLATGAWSKILGERLGWDLPVKPIRGQIVLLALESLPFTHILEIGPQYLVPRSDGRILIGSTMEDVGFVKQNSVDGVQSLIEFATRLVPELNQARFETCWSGLRPGSADGLPFIGKSDQWTNLLYAFGHFRDGLQQSCGTALLIQQLLQEEETSIDVTPFSLNRVQSMTHV